MLSFDPLAVLSDEHAELAQMFARHQEALVGRRWARAARLLEHYSQCLRRHIGIEEQLLLPQLETLAAGIRWNAQVYRIEHRRIELLLDKNRERLARARRRSVTPLKLVTLLEEEKTLKHLVEHHHEREELALFAEMRRALPAAACAELARALAAAGASSV